MTLRARLNCFPFWVSSLNPGLYIATECGHFAKHCQRITAYGTTIWLKNNVVDGSVQYCHTCLTEMTIRCAFCGGPIFIGDAVTLYHPSALNGMEVPEWPIVFHDGHPVGGICCAELGYADMCGVWVPGENLNGKVKPWPPRH